MHIWSSHLDVQSQNGFSDHGDQGFGKHRYAGDRSHMVGEAKRPQPKGVRLGRTEKQLGFVRKVELDYLSELFLKNGKQLL